MEGLHYGVSLPNGDVRYRKGADIIVENRGEVDSYALGESIRVGKGQVILTLRKIRTSTTEEAVDMTFIVLQAGAGRPLILRFAAACHTNGFPFPEYAN